jgi:arylsulfatase A-like enzyme
VDILPTLLKRCGQSIPEWCEGQVLPGFGLDGDVHADAEMRSVYMVEAKENAMFSPLQNATFAIVRGQYKLVHYLGYEGYDNVFELYDLHADPEELHNLSDEAPELADQLAQELEEQRLKNDLRLKTGG